MRPAQRARGKLKGNWLTANAVQCTQLAFGLTVLIGGWLYGVVLLGMLVLDWLLVSPVLAGQALYYRRLARSGGTAAAPADGDGRAARAMLEKTQEIRLPAEKKGGYPPARLPGREEKQPEGGRPEQPPYTLVFTFYRQGYGRALRWRLGLFIRRLGWGALCYAPSALIAGYRELLRRGGSDTPLADLTMLLCTLLGLMALLGGFVALEMLMLRYLPAQYLLADPEERHLFRRARQIMRGRMGEAIWLYLGFAGWFAACFAVLPYFYAAPLFQTMRAQAFLRFLRQAPPEKEGRSPGRSAMHRAAKRGRRRRPQPAMMRRQPGLRRGELPKNGL